MKHVLLIASSLLAFSLAVLYLLTVCYLLLTWQGQAVVGVAFILSMVINRPKG